MHIGKVELGVNTVGIHIHSERDNVHVTGALTVTKECAFYTVSACQECQFRVGNACTSVVVGTKRKCYKFTVFKIYAYIFNLRILHVWQAHFHRYGQIYNNIIICARLQHIKNGVANL